MFLAQQDFEKLKNAQEITVMLTEDGYNVTDILNESIDYAVDFIKSKLQHRYDPDQIFIEITDYDNTATYSENELVYYQNVIYFAKQETTGNDPPDATYWTKGDLRHSLIKNYAIKIALKELYLRVQPRVIPEWIMDEAEKAETHLNRVSSGKDTVVLPVKTDADGNNEGETFLYGSETQKHWNF